MEKQQEKKEFCLDWLSDRIFIIVSKDQFDKTGSIYLHFPMTVYGFLNVEGTSFDKSFTSQKYIADELLGSKELDLLSEEARERVFPQND